MSLQNIDKLAADKTPEQVQIELKGYTRVLMLGVMLLGAGLVLQIVTGLKFLMIIGVVTLGVGYYYRDLYRIVAKRQAEIKKPT